MADHLTGHSREQLEWAIEQLVQTRKEYRDLKKSPATSALEVQRKDILMQSKLHAFRGFLKYFLPERNGPDIPYSRYNLSWSIPYYSMSFDTRTLAGSTNLENVETMWMNHPSDFIDLIKTGKDSQTRMREEREYNQLKEEIEALIEQFKTIIVTDEFL